MINLFPSKKQKKKERIIEVLKISEIFVLGDGVVF